MFLNIPGSNVKTFLIFAYFRLALRQMPCLLVKFNLWVKTLPKKTSQLLSTRYTLSDGRILTFTGMVNRSPLCMVSTVL